MTEDELEALKDEHWYLGFVQGEKETWDKFRDDHRKVEVLRVALKVLLSYDIEVSGPARDIAEKALEL